MTEDEYTGGSAEERLARSERRIAELDALVKGLTDEVLDLKAVVMKLKKDQRPPPVIQAVAPSVARNKGPGLDEEQKAGRDSLSQDSPVQAKEKITLKMQPDGTLKPMRDMSEDIIVASARDARFKGKNEPRPGQSDLIIVDDEELTE